MLFLVQCWNGLALQLKVYSLHFILEHSDDVICRTRKIKPINHYLAVLLAMLCTGEKCMTSWKEKLSDTLRHTLIEGPTHGDLRTM